MDRLVTILIRKIRGGKLKTPEDILDIMAPGLTRIGDGACDTVVKECVAWHLQAAMEEQNIPRFGMLMYGW